MKRVSYLILIKSVCFRSDKDSYRVDTVSFQGHSGKKLNLQNNIHSLSSNQDYISHTNQESLEEYDS